MLYCWPDDVLKVVETKPDRERSCQGFLSCQWGLPEAGNVVNASAANCPVGNRVATCSQSCIRPVGVGRSKNLVRDQVSLRKRRCNKCQKNATTKKSLFMLPPFFYRFTWRPAVSGRTLGFPSHPQRMACFIRFPSMLYTLFLHVKHNRTGFGKINYSPFLPVFSTRLRSRVRGLVGR